MSLKLITVPPCCSDTRPTIIHPPTTSSAVALAPKDQKHVLSLLSSSVVHKYRCSMSLGLSAIVPLYKSILGPPFHLDKPKLSIQSSTSLSTSILSSNFQKYMTPHTESLKTIQTCTMTAIILYSHSDSPLAVASRSSNQEYITTLLTRFVTPPIAPTLSIDHSASI